MNIKVKENSQVKSSSDEDRCCGNRAYEDRCAEATGRGGRYYRWPKSNYLKTSDEQSKAICIWWSYIAPNVSAPILSTPPTRQCIPRKSGPGGYVYYASKGEYLPKGERKAMDILIEVWRGIVNEVYVNGQPTIFPEMPAFVNGEEVNITVDDRDCQETD